MGQPQSQIAEEALKLFGALYDVEREVRDAESPTSGSGSARREHGRSPTRLHTWLMLHRQKVPDGSATAKAIDYSLNAGPR